jgi:hypothetical protein
LAREELQKTLFFNPKTISLYNEQAKVMKLDEFQEGFCTSIFKKTENDSLKKIVRFKASPPESFTTKTGIKFTKAIRKDGKAVYVSERIRPNEADSWYFARDYAERLNKEENCADCYQLPEFDDIENLKPKQVLNRWEDRDFEDTTWLKSWSPAPLGITFGNFCTWIPCFLYTFDYLHDILAHPFTWQSYIYPISPDNKKFWKSGLRSLRTMRGSIIEKNIFVGWGFRLVRPLQ